MAPNPLKPLVKGTFVMGLIAVVTLAASWFIAEMKEAEARRSRLTAENQQRIEEAQARFKAENEARRKKLQEADRRTFTEREAAEAKRKAELAKRRQIDVFQRVEAVRVKAANGDPEAQYLYGCLCRFGLSGLGDFNPDGTVRQLRPMVAYPVFGENLFGKTNDVLFVDLPVLERDEKAALEWFERAALQGHDEAQYEVAHHRTFAGPGEDLVEAYKWYLVAKTRYFDSRDVVHSTRRLGDDGRISYATLPPDSRPYVPPGLLNSLKPAQKAEAEKRAKAFKPKKENP